MENKAGALKARIRSYREAAAQAPTVIKVLKQFDKKVYNVKLDRAMMEATENKIRVFEHYGYVEIYALYSDSYCHITLARFDKSKLENRRLDAETLITQVREHRERLLKDAYELETYIDQAEQIKAYINSTVEKINSYCQSLPSDIRDIYKIPYCVRTY